MNKKDTLQRFVFENLPVRGELIRLDESYQTIMNQHKYPPVIEKVLGEMLAAASLLIAGVKFEGRVTVQFQGKGSVKLLVAQCNHLFQVRGLAQWTGEIDHFALLNQLREGILVIIMDPSGEGSQRYQGIVNFKGNSIAESIEEYFKQSEQLPTRIWLAQNETTVAGLFIQVLPAEEDADHSFEHISHLSTTITPEELLTLSQQEILHRLYHQEEIRVFDPIPIHFGCQCSAKRSEDALLMLGREEAERELHEKQKIIVQCEFCSKEYIFDRADVEKLFNQDNHWLH